VSAAWASLDPGEYPFTRTVADQLRDHDDRVQFLDGIDLILAGISGLRRAPAGLSGRFHDVRERGLPDRPDRGSSGNPVRAVLRL
jgi:hypothetical protein